MMDRRSFVKVAAGAAAGGMLGLGCSKDTVPVEIAPGRTLGSIGVQLYSVRYLLEADFSGTLEAVADAGFQEVEFHNLFGNSPEEVRAMLDGLGLTAPATHVSLARLREDISGVISEARTVGHEYVISPWVAEDERGSIDAYRRLAASFKEWGQI